MAEIEQQVEIKQQSARPIELIKAKVPTVPTESRLDEIREQTVKALEALPRQPLSEMDHLVMRLPAHVDRGVHRKHPLETLQFP